MYLTTRRSKAAIVLITATVIEMALLIVSLVDKSIGVPPYKVSEYALGLLQVLVLIVLIAGYIYLAQPHLKNIKKRSRS